VLPSVPSAIFSLVLFFFVISSLLEPHCLPFRHSFKVSFFFIHPLFHPCFASHPHTGRANGGVRDKQDRDRQRTRRHKQATEGTSRQTRQKKGERTVNSSDSLPAVPPLFSLSLSLLLSLSTLHPPREREREREKEETQDQSGQTDETMDMSFHPHTFIHSFVHHDNIPHTHLLFVRSFSHTGANTIKDACNQSACLHTLMQITYRKEEKENHRGGNEASFLGRHVLLSGKRERKVVPPCFPSPTRQIERNPTRDTRPDNHPTEKTPSIASPQEHPTSFMHLLIVSQRSNQSVLPKSSPLFSPCTDLPGQTGQLRKELLPRWHATSVVVENSAFRVLPPE